MEASQKAGTSECPVCSKYFELDKIENHVNRCLFLAAPSTNKIQPLPNKSTNSESGKRSFGIFNKPQTSPSTNKKPRIEITERQDKQDVEVIEVETEIKKKPPEIKLNVPLAEEMRPKTLDEYYGQNHIVDRNTILRTSLESNDIPSMILWGPPGCGKTTLAHIIANRCKENQSSGYRFVKLSATMSGVNDVKEVVKVAKNEIKFKRRTILFMDEIHRFNKAQQDTFLPHIENGTIVLIGATTENPSFSLNSALLSRCRVIVLEKLKTDCLLKILERGLRYYDTIILEETGNNVDFKEFVPKMAIEKSSVQWLAEMCDGDARIALNTLQITMQVIREGNKTMEEDGNSIKMISIESLKEGIKKSHLLYDRKGDQHYDCISALHKSIRASDDNAALYWCTRMMEGGEDPRFICRRLIRAASEDIGLADANAVQVAVAAYQAVQLIGMPESDVIIAQCAVYLARAPKSRDMDNALKKCKIDIKSCKGALPPVPLHLRNAPTKLMSSLGYGAGYNMQQKEESGLTYMPEGLEDQNYFTE